MEIKTLRNKCDRVLQNLGRQKYKSCLVCGQPMTVLHHFWPKSVASALRYYWPNLVPLDFKCHMRHHLAGDPTIHARIIELKGKEWYNDLLKRKNQIIKANKSYYEQKLEELEKLSKK